ncbi:MAG TPA: lytic murein transglycosylase B [Gammaproteobacteria bacterium]|jgi:membrane-bound lytic murein transglycosylase B|nr:lytic murein transglycosylase B [Gammaproteobacteria bacterium]
MKLLKFSGSVALALIVTCGAAFAATASKGYLAKPAVQKFIDEMVTQHDFDRAKLDALFAGARYRQSIIDSMNRPAESLPWYRYRNIFLTSKRTAGGVDFQHAHAKTLARAEKVYGVPPAIVTAIIGVESYYGGNKGAYPVIDALATLGFDYPPRADFFRKELAQYLLLSREQHFDPATVTGSYAGAMGAPQFISSSYRHYAVDFDGDGKSDLWHDWADIIGSIANYFADNGWQRGAGIVVPAKLKAGAKGGIESMDTTTAATLRKAGFKFSDKIADDADVTLVALDAHHGKRYWVALHNFGVIMTYNHSPLYAMAVYQLSEAIKQKMNGD